MVQAAVQEGMPQDGSMLQGRSPSHSATESLSGDTTAAGLECTAAAGLPLPPLGKASASCDAPTDQEYGQPDTAKVLAHSCAVADGGDCHLEQAAPAVALVVAEEQGRGCWV